MERGGEGRDGRPPDYELATGMPLATHEVSAFIHVLISFQCPATTLTFGSCAVVLFDIMLPESGIH